MSKGDILRAMDYLSHIVQAIDRIHRYVEVHHTEFAAAHCAVPWALMDTVCNRVAHGYTREHPTPCQRWRAVGSILHRLHIKSTNK